MKNFSNSAKAICIHLIAIVVTIFWISFAHLDFESGDEVWLIVGLIVFYLICGFFFLDTQQKMFFSLLPFLIYFLVISTLLSLPGNITYFILFINPIGWILGFDISNNIEMPMIIAYAFLALIPPLLLYIGIKFRALYKGKNID